MVPGNVALEEVANFEQWYPAVGVGCFALHALYMQLVSRQAALSAPHSAPMSRKEMQATEAAILQAQSLLCFRTAGKMLIQNVDQVAEKHKVHYVSTRLSNQYFKLGSK
jgi:hypothetical protein